jgi:lipopolysaccharide biosynthesis glycosyltransferase
MTMHVACAADERYVAHAAAMLHSLLTSNAGHDVAVHWLAPPDFPRDSRDNRCPGSPS